MSGGEAEAYERADYCPPDYDGLIDAAETAAHELDWYASEPMRDVVGALERSGFVVEHGHDVVEVWQESPRGDVPVMCVERGVQTHDEALSLLWTCEARGEWAA